MTREEAIQWLETVEVLGFDDKVDSIEKAIKMAIDALKATQWIPCSERLPDEDTEVLVTVYFHGLAKKHPPGWNKQIKPTYYVEAASQIDGEWSSYSDEYKIARDRHEVIAWMPKPSPYKGEE